MGFTDTIIVSAAAIFTFLLVNHGTVLAHNDEPPCDDDIYCHGPLLHTVQMAKLYKDSKTFVDKPLKNSRSEVQKNFNKLMEATDNHPDRAKVLDFVNENFLPEGTEFEEWKPKDWHETIPLFSKIKDPKYKEFAKKLHSIWKDLGRQIKKDVAGNPHQTSLIYLEKPFIVPGGRFREMYYWDSYWSIMGLLHSQMNETVKGMLENFASLVDIYGLIPNGNRVYYTRRSQPPLFITMVDDYYKVTSDRDFLEKNIAILDKEFNFFYPNRTKHVTVGDQVYKMAFYDVKADGPRPESYYEDYIDAENFTSNSEKTEFYRNMKSGAESGWDYSTKWFVKKSGEDSLSIKDIQTRHIVPVELNSYICRNAKIMANFYNILGDSQKSKQYSDIAIKIQEAIEKVLWNGADGSWYDYDTKHKKQRKNFYPSNLTPLWAKCIQDDILKDKTVKVLDYIKKSKAFDYPGGVPTSMVKSGQQWDLSNAWAPLQEIIVTGLENTGDSRAKAIALDLANKWIKNNYVAFEQSKGKMFEKYDVEKVGASGGGGEYDVVVGFGWSNGVAMHFLEKYGDLLEFEKKNLATSTHQCGSAIIIISVFSVIFGIL